jgi:predicted GTPase
MINIPSTIEGVSNMLQGEYGRHPGLLAAMSSLKNKRSSKNAYILTVGSTGSGKSSAVR